MSFSDPDIFGVVVIQGSMDSTRGPSRRASLCDRLGKIVEIIESFYIEKTLKKTHSFL